MSLPINELKMVLDTLPLEKKDKDEVKRCVETMYEVNQFLVDKLNISEEAIEKIVAINTSTKIKKIIEKDESLIEDKDRYLDAICGIISEFARDNGFQKHEQLKEDTKTLITILDKNGLNL